jgi:hypothetical protein
MNIEFKFEEVQSDSAGRRHRDSHEYFPEQMTPVRYATSIITRKPIPPIKSILTGLPVL